MFISNITPETQFEHAQIDTIDNYTGFVSHLWFHNNLWLGVYGVITFDVCTC